MADRVVSGNFATRHPADVDRDAAVRDAQRTADDEARRSGAPRADFLDLLWDGAVLRAEWRALIHEGAA